MTKDEFMKAVALFVCDRYRFMALKSLLDDIGKYDSGVAWLLLNIDGNLIVKVASSEKEWIARESDDMVLLKYRLPYRPRPPYDLDFQMSNILSRCQAIYSAYLADEAYINQYT